MFGKSMRLIFVKKYFLDNFLHIYWVYMYNNVLPPFIVLFIVTICTNIKTNKIKSVKRRVGVRKND